MTCRLKNALKSLRLLPRAMAMTLVLAAPVLAVPYLQSAEGSIIEAPAMKKTGAGFVLMVSLRRG